MKKIKATALFCTALLGIGISSCKKDKYVPQTDLAYDVVVDGATASFKVTTTGVTNYQWDFGDGTKSTDAAPTHTYPGKGKYVPTLVASVNGRNAESSTVLRIAKTSPVKLNDNSLADWDAVTKDVVTLGPAKGVMRAVKFDYDGNNIYAYIEMARKRSDADIFDFYIDSDNSPATGLLTGTFTGGGYDILLEGQLLASGIDIFYHSGTDQNAFSFAQQSISDAITVGTVQEANGITKFEMRIARGKLKGLTGTGARFGIQVTKNDYSVLYGSAPDPGNSSYLLDMSE